MSRRFKLRWNEDCAFSKKFMSRIKEIVNKTTLPKKIQNNVGTKEDLKGHDLTVNPKPSQIGVRTRRAKYIYYDEFTEDFKEFYTMEDDYYFYGYAYNDESGLYSYIVFDHDDYRRARKKGELRWTIAKNEEHSDRYFFCVPLYDITKYCNILAKHGSIAHIKQRISTYETVKPTKNNIKKAIEKLGLLKSPFPYSDTDPRPKMCKWSGDGYIYCTASIRKKYAKICDICPQNPNKNRGVSSYE